MSRCLYCGRPSVREYCSLSCEQYYYDYLERVDALGVYFLLGLVSSVLLFLTPVFLGHPLPFLGMGLMLLGVTLSFLPFAPSFVVGMTGAGRSQRFVRIAGYTAAAAGAAATLLSLLPPLS